MSVTKTIDISVLPEAEQDLIKALFDKCCERATQKVAEVKPRNTQKPKYGDKYYYIGTDGYICIEQWKDRSLDEARWGLGNVFLQRFADEHNDLDKEKWDGENVHYCIEHDAIQDDLTVTAAAIFRGIYGIYFTSKEIAEEAANKIGVKRIMKYLFDVDCEVDE